MEFWLWTIIAVFGIVISGLCIRIWLLRKAAEEIRAGFEEKLKKDTNTLIGISSGDRMMAELADSINRQLCLLRSERCRFQQGDQELKNAVTGISHDLRTPLTAVYGYLELAEREQIPDSVRRYLSQIRNRADVMKQLTEELFRYSVVSSVEDLQLEEIDLRAVLSETLMSFYGAMEQKDITPSIEMTEHPVIRMIDRKAAGRIFSNIISNALKYSDGDFTVTMNRGGTIIFANTAEDLDAVTVARLFDRFYTVETARNATGMGLSIAKLLTERLNGSICAEYAGGTLYIIVSFPS